MAGNGNNLESTQVQVLSSVDGLEALITTLNGLVSTSSNQTTANGLLTDIKALATALNGLVSTSANQTTANGLLTDIKALATALNGLVSTSANQTTANNTLSSILALLKGNTNNYRSGVLTASTNATSVYAGANWLNTISTNKVTSGFWLKIYDKATTPTVGTDVPALTVYIVPQSGAVTNTILTSIGLKLSNGLAFATTNAGTDTDTGVIAASGNIQLGYSI